MDARARHDPPLLCDVADDVEGGHLFLTVSEDVGGGVCFGEPALVGFDAVVDGAFWRPAELLELADVGADVARVTEAVLARWLRLVVAVAEDLGDDPGELGDR